MSIGMRSRATPPNFQSRPFVACETTPASSSSATAIAAVRAERAFELEEVDVSLDPALYRDYGERIPVVAIEGRDELELGVDARALRECLDRVGA